MKRNEIIFYSAILAVVNVPLLFGVMVESMTFVPAEVLNGQVWRIVTHPFVHVSWYHLLLDGVAFLMLYNQLEAKTFAGRTVYVAAAAVFSMLAVMLVLPYSTAVGYCGLSGIDHGLMAVCALEMIRSKGAGRAGRWFGLISLVVVLGKSLYEAYSGHMFLEFMHFGMMGSPVAISHLGGVIGGVGVFILVNGFERSFENEDITCITGC
jgi:rhomboid family GlyGly-CTERM serine protease